MSKAAESLQRRFGQNLSESLGVRAGGGDGPGFVGPPPPMGFPRETSPDDGRTRARDAGHMEIDRIVPDPDQPRKEFSDDAIERLAASLLKHGQLMPIRVRWNPKIAKWVVISGEHRRFRAATRAGLKTVSACVFADDGLSPLGDPPGTDRREPAPRGSQADRAGPSLPPAHGSPRLDRQGTLRRAPSEPGSDVSKSLSLLTLPVEFPPGASRRVGSIPATAQPPTRSPRSKTRKSKARLPGGSCRRGSRPGTTPPPRSFAKLPASRSEGWACEIEGSRGAQPSWSVWSGSSRSEGPRSLSPSLARRSATRRWCLPWKTRSSRPEPRWGKREPEGRFPGEIDPQRCRAGLALPIMRARQGEPCPAFCC